MNSFEFLSLSRTFLDFLYTVSLAWGTDKLAYFSGVLEKYFCDKGHIGYTHPVDNSTLRCGVNHIGKGVFWLAIVGGI